MTGTRLVNTTITGPTGQPSTFQPVTGDPPPVEVTHNVIVPTGAATPGKPTATAASVPEPSVAANGSIVFYVANWMAALTTDAGKSWSYLDPTKDVTNVGQDFCCDQDILFDHNHGLAGIFIWYRQGSTASNLNGADTITIYDPKVGSWCEYFWATKDFDPSWSGTWLDYPHISVDVNNFFLSSNRFDASGNEVATDMIRISIPAMLSCGNLGVRWWNHPANGGPTSFGPVDDAQDLFTMYWATHDDNDKLTVYEWGDGFQSPGGVVVSIPSFSSTNKGDATCTDPGGGNACGRMDDRVLGGWIETGHIYFYWNVKASGNAPFPYTYVAYVDYNSLAYQGHYDIWSKDAAMVYGSVALNEVNSAGMAVLVAGGSNPLSEYPTVAVAYPGTGLTWSVPTVGTGGPSGPGGGNPDCSPKCGGDYLRVKPYYGLGSGISWIASAYSFQGGNSNANVQLRYYVFQPASLMDFTISVKPALAYTSPGSALLPAALITVHRLSSMHIVPVGIDVQNYLPLIGTTDYDVNVCLSMTSPICDTQLLIATSPNAAVGSYQIFITGTAIGDKNVAHTQFTLNLVTPAVGGPHGYTVNFAGAVSIVAISGNATVGGFSYDSSLRAVEFNVSGTQGTLGNLRVDVPQSLLVGTPRVLVDGNPVNSIFLQNSTDFFVYFATHLSTHSVTVIGSGGTTTESTSAASSTSTAPSTTPTTSNLLVYGAVVVVLIVGAIFVALRLRKPKALPA